jgi:hypothetical protein
VKLSAKEVEMLARLLLAMLLSVSLATAKSYSITLSDRAKVGDTELKPGEYKLKLEADKVMLIDREGRTIETKAKVETVERKFNQTAVGLTKKEGTNKLEWIALGGSKSRVVFE